MLQVGCDIFDVPCNASNSNNIRTPACFMYACMYIMVDWFALYILIWLQYVHNGWLICSVYSHLITIPAQCESEDEKRKWMDVCMRSIYSPLGGGMFGKTCWDIASFLWSSQRSDNKLVSHFSWWHWKNRSDIVLSLDKVKHSCCFTFNRGRILYKELAIILNFL